MKAVRKPLISGQLLLLAAMIVVLIGASFRFSALRWGSDAHRKADEENFLHVQSILEAPRGLSEYFDPRSSPANPYLRELAYPVYGSFPAWTAKMFTGASAAGERPLIRHRSRFLAATTDLIVLLIVGAIGVRAFSVPVGLLAMTLYALFPLAIANAHAATSAWGALIPNAILLAILLPGRNASQKPPTLLSFLAFGLVLGLAVSTDPRNILMISALPYVHLFRSKGQERPGLAMPAICALLVLCCGWVVFRVVQPYAFQEKSLAAFHPQFLDAAEKILLAKTTVLPEALNGADSAFAKLSKMTELGFWAWGPLGFVLLSVILLGAMIPRAISGADPQSLALGTIVLSYLMLLLFQDHPDPLTLLFASPAAALLIAEFIVYLPGGPAVKPKTLWQSSSLIPWLATILLCSGALSAFLSTSLYAQSNSLDRASRWLSEYLMPDATILVERGAPRLPGPIDGRTPGPFRFAEFSLLDDDFNGHEAQFRSEFQRANALILSSSEALEPGRINRRSASQFLNELVSPASRFRPAASFSCNSRFIRWPQYRRWIPAEMRYDICPPVVIFVPKNASVSQ